ncbi:MAG: peptidase S8 [Alphaproteobacteria bacterium]|nr:peptidase S8 [Alphaproteobacteria bacterium]
MYNTPSIRTFEPRLRERVISNDLQDGIGLPGRFKRPGLPGNNASNTDNPSRNPGRKPPRRPPGVTPGVATGVIIATVPPAGAVPPPPPNASRGQPPGGGAPQAAINLPPPNEQRFVKNEVVLEFPGNVPPQQSAALAARHRLTQLEQTYFPLTNTTWFRLRINDGRSVPTVLRALAREGGVQSGQPNYIYRAGQHTGRHQGANFVPLPQARPRATPVVASAGARPAGGDPAQYTLAKLRVPEAHGLATGDRVLVAVIDSGVDAGHPEIAGVIAGTYDALGSGEPPHAHGTAIAGAIAAHAKLMGVAPRARILAIRAFGTAGASAEATTFAILKGVAHASEKGARVINMSFAGPNDPALSRHLAAARAKGAVLIAASGNFGPKSPPQYPAADPNVIAVSATDAKDNLFKAANRGRHIAVAAPGVDILLPAPNADYQLTSGTSFAAAHVSGIAALILERKPDLTPDAVRKVLLSNAKDLGPRGKDDQFGAGLVDAYSSILSLESDAAAAQQSVQQPASAQ